MNTKITPKLLFFVTLGLLAPQLPTTPFASNLAHFPQLQSTANAQNSQGSRNNRKGSGRLSRRQAAKKGPRLNAQKQKQALVSAEQAFARLDYTRALSLSRLVVQSNGKNLAARRIAATSALKLKRFQECLQFIFPIPYSDATGDDVHVAGECAMEGNSLQKNIRYFETIQRFADKQDAASYWLGQAAYLAENYALADEELSQVVVLPSRFQEKKTFMQERINDYLKSKIERKRPAPKNDSKVKTGSKGKRNKSASKQKRQPLIPRVPRRDKQNGSFTNFGAEVRLGFAAGVEDVIDTRSGSQKAFDKELVKANQEDQDPKLTTIDAKAGNIFFPVTKADARFTAGYRSGNYIEDNGTEFGVGAKISATYSGLTLDYYTISGTRTHPSTSSILYGGGAGIRLFAHADYRPNPYFILNTELFVDRVFANFDAQYGLIGAKGSATLRTKTFFATFGGFWSLLQGADFGVGGDWNGIDLNVGLTDLGLFSIDAPLGHSTLSYHESFARSDSPTTSINHFVETEGTFFELNVAPSIKFLDDYRALVWFRFVSASNAVTALQFQKICKKSRETLLPRHQTLNMKAHFLTGTPQWSTPLGNGEDSLVVLAPVSLARAT